MQPDHFSIETDILMPDVWDAGFDGHAFATRFRQNLFTIFFRFTVKALEARHRNNPDTVAEFFRGSEGVLQFAPTRHDDEVEFSLFLFRNVTATQNPFATRAKIDIVQHRNDLAGQCDESGTVGA